MREKIPIAALALSVVAFVIVLFSPTPKDPKKAGGGPTERVSLRVLAEETALAEDRAEIERIAERAGELGGSGKRAGTEDAAVTKLIKEMVAAETEKRWGDFQKSLKTLSQFEKTRPIDPKKLAGVVIDDVNAKRTGWWVPSKRNRPFVGVGYHHDDAARDGKSRARFAVILPRAGRYEVRFFYPPFENRATKVPVTVYHADGVKKIAVNQRKAPPGGNTGRVLGTFRFAVERDAAVVIANSGTDGSVAVDAVQFVPVK